MNLITGGTGFLGAHLAAHLLTLGEDVKILKRAASSLGEIEIVFKYYFGDDFRNKLASLSFCDGDLLNPHSIENALQNVNNVYHCAATVSFQKRDKQSMFDVNVTGTENLVNVLLNSNNKKLCHVSSIASLGRNTNNTLIDEQSVRDNNKLNTTYSQSKYLSELEVWRGIAEGLPAVIVLPGVILGPGDLKKGTCKLFALVNKGLKFYTTGVNGYVDVEDVADIMIRLMKSDIIAERFVLVSENVSYRDLLTSIAINSGKKPPSVYAGRMLRKIVVSADGAWAIVTGKQRYFSADFARIAGARSEFSSEKIKSMLKFQFNSVNECIEKTTEFYKRDSML